MSLRIESLLLAMPLLLFFVLYHFYDALSIDPYFGVSVPFILSTNILIFHIPIFLIPYLMHRFMRDQDKGHVLVNFLHVALSIFLLIALMFTYQVIQPSSPDRGTPIFDLPENKLWMEATMATYVILGAQLLLQIAFIFIPLPFYFLPNKNSPFRVIPIN
ncbi:hypothetical protein [Sediminibacterium sp. C3]|uniref:hypothetical protein n=1 Tax=Sediminibacterium sp. C3 TaxID=1267211 RepID=UPI001268FF74|nr:hypothetical protein [Sediminibacterium sp. C3]